MIFQVFTYGFGEWPRRFTRLLLHLVPFTLYRSYTYKLQPKSVLDWLMDLPFYIFDCVFIPEFFEIGNILFSRHVRLMTGNEMAVGKEFFGEEIDWQFVKVKTRLNATVQKKAHAFVSFNMVNYHKRIRPEIFVHELVHIWQYQRFGSAYIYRALKAQASAEGYDYGGVQVLYHDMLNNKKQLIDYNFEQQAEIFEDYFRIKYGLVSHQPQIAVPVYQYFTEQVFVKGSKSQA